MKIQTAKIVGVANQKSWSQVHLFRPEEEQKSQEYGQLMATLSFKAKKEEIKVSSFGTEIITRLQEMYYSNESESVIKKIEQTMESLKAEFFNEVELQVVMGVVLKVGDERVLYVGRRGGGQVYLKRGDDLVKLLTKNEEEGEVVSGKLENRDKFVLGTSKFFKLAGEEFLRAGLEESGIEKMAESLAGIIHGHEKNSRAAGVVVLNLQSQESAKPDKPSNKVRAGEFLKKGTDKIKGLVKKREQRAVEVRSRNPKKQRATATVIVVLLLVFGVSLVLAGKKRQETKQEAEYQAMIEQVEYKYDEAMGLKELNPLRAKSLLLDSKKIIEDYKNQNEKANGKLDEFMQKIEQELGEVQREYEVEGADEWFDFSLVKEGFEVSDWTVDENTILAWDKNTKTVVELNLKTKASKVVMGGDKLEAGEMIGLTGNRGFVVSLKQNLISIVDIEDEEVVDEMGEVEWGRIIDVVGFGSNLYLLDGTTKGQIYKYVGVDSGLSSQRDYLKGDDYDFSSAKSMAIDGSVWVLFEDGTIVKYVRGQKDAFTIAGLDEDFKEPVKLFTESALDNLYVLDRQATRVVVLDKSGEYQAQYKWPGIAGVKDLVVSEEIGKMFLLTGKKVFTLDLHL